jgi:hypothetical protein
VIGAYEQSAVHAAADPISFPCMHIWSDVHDVGQLDGGSQVSRSSTTPFPQLTGQSLSVLAFAPMGQHMSPGTAAVTGM